MAAARRSTAAAAEVVEALRSSPTAVRQARGSGRGGAGRGFRLMTWRRSTRSLSSTTSSPQRDNNHLDNDENNNEQAPLLGGGRRRQSDDGNNVNESDNNSNREESSPMGRMLAYSPDDDSLTGQHFV